MKRILALSALLMLAAAAQAQVFPPPSGGGGSAPGGSSTSEQYRLNSTTFGGTTTIYLVPSGGDDSSQITTACATGAMVHLAATPSTHFSITTGVTIPQPCSIRGEGTNVTLIDNHGTTNYVFTSTYYQAGEPTTKGYGGLEIGGFSVVQIGTPTAGGLINVQPSAGGVSAGLILHGISTQGLYDNLDLNGTASRNIWNSFFYDMIFNDPVATTGGCINYNVSSPGGDNVINFSCRYNNGLSNPGIVIANADITSFVNVKCNNCRVLLTATAGTNVDGVRFVNPSLEDGDPGTYCAFTALGAGGTIGTVNVIGGELASNFTAMGCTSNGVKNFVFTSVLDRTADNTSGYQIVSSAAALKTNKGSGIDDSLPGSFVLFSSSGAVQIPGSAGGYDNNQGYYGFNAVADGNGAQHYCPYGLAGAAAATAEVIEGYGGNLYFMTDTGLTNGTCYTATKRATLDSTGLNLPTGESYKINGVSIGKWSCQPGLGDGTNAITAATYPQTTCKNDTGSTVTITGVTCYADGGSSTVNVSAHTLGALLTGAITCSTSWAAGTQSANVLLTSGDYLTFSFVADGTTKQSTWAVKGTY